MVGIYESVIMNRQYALSALIGAAVAGSYVAICLSKWIFVAE
jgi:hypothetical protein